MGYLRSIADVDVYTFFLFSLQIFLFGYFHFRNRNSKQHCERIVTQVEKLKTHLDIEIKYLTIKKKKKY